MKISIETTNHNEQLIEEVINQETLETWARYYDKIQEDIVKIRKENVDTNPSSFWTTLKAIDKENMYYNPDFSNITYTLTLCVGNWVEDSCRITCTISFPNDLPVLHRVISAEYCLNGDRVEVEDLDSFILPCEYKKCLL